MGTGLVNNKNKAVHGALCVVYGIRRCGGTAEVLECRLEGCTTTESTCELEANDQLRKVGMDIIPTEDEKQLGTRITFRFPGVQPTLVYERLMENSTVMAGKMSTMGAMGRASQADKGKLKLMTVKWEILKSDLQTFDGLCGG